MDPWLEALRGRLPRHAALIDAMLEISRGDVRIRILELQCSIARGAGDELSDLDMGIAARDDAWEAVAADLEHRLPSIAPTVDLHAHTMPEWGARPHRRLFVQYADGRQLDLVVQPAGPLKGRVPGAVVLHDPDGRLASERHVPIASATSDDARGWELTGWELLANVAKYLARRSAWEAHARLELARDMALRLWAAGEDVPYPAFGLVSLLDADPPRLPPGLEATVAGLDAEELAVAARACAALLRESAAHARRRLASPQAESPMAEWVGDLLERAPASARP